MIVMTMMMMVMVTTKTCMFALSALLYSWMSGFQISDWPKWICFNPAKKWKYCKNWFRINSITSKQSWVPGQILICPVQSHPAIHLKGWLNCKQCKLDFVEGFAILNQKFGSRGGVHLKNGHFFIKVEVYERHAEVNLDWFGMVEHLGRKSKIRCHR